MSTGFTFHETPYIAVATKAFWTKVCHVCFKDLPDAPPLLCDACKSVFYCSKQCRDKELDTNQHLGAECEVFQKISDEEFQQIQGDYIIRFITRIMTRRENDKGIPPPESFYGFPSDMKPRQLEDLLTNEQHIPDNEWGMWDLFQKIYRPHSQLFKTIDRTEFRRVLGWYCTNAFRILSYNHKLPPSFVGAALFLQCSRFDHTCGTPDLIWYTVNWQMRMKAKDPNLKVTGQNINHLRISYGIHGHHVNLTSERGAYLNYSFFFDCSCSLCADILADRRKSALKIKCHSCQQTLIIKGPKEDEPASNYTIFCKNDCPPTTPEPLTLATIEKVFHHQDEKVQITPADLQKLIDEAGAIFSEENVYWNRLKDNLYDCITDKRSQAELCEQILEYYANNDVEVETLAIICAKLADQYEHLGDSDKSSEYEKKTKAYQLAATDKDVVWKRK